MSNGVVSLKSDATEACSGDSHINGATYLILRFPETPHVEVDMINIAVKCPGAQLSRPAITIPAAITNAVYGATGARTRSVPYTPEKVLPALKAGKHGGVSKYR